LGGFYRVGANIYVEPLEDNAKYCGQIVHAEIASLRQRPVKALAGRPGLKVGPSLRSENIS
jgi:hypothetical protein